MLREKLRELEAKEKEFKDMKNLESVLVHEQNLVRAKDAEITKLQKMTHQLRERLKASERVNAQLNSRNVISIDDDELEKTKKELNDAKKVLQSKDANIVQLSTQNNMLTVELKNLKTNGAHTNSSSPDHEKEIEKLTKKVNAQLNSRNVISIDDDELEKTRKELNDAKKLLQTKDANIVQLSTQNNVLTVELKNLKTNGAHTNTSSLDLEKEIEKLTKKVNAQKQMLQVKQTEIDLLREQIEAADI